MTSADTTLRADPASPRLARRFVTSTLTRWKCQHVADMVTLLTSELVTNAVLHAGGPVRLAVTLDGRTVRIAVTDPSPAPPVRRRVEGTSTTGRGVALVDGLATRWGVSPSPHGKSVWFEVTT